MPTLDPLPEGYYRIAFYGKMCAGKTWCANYLENRLSAEGKFIYRTALARELKDIAADLFDVTSKNGVGREVLQKIGQTFREIDPDVWIKNTLLEMSWYTTKPVNIIVDDVRYLNEAESFRANGFVLIKAYTPEELRVERITRLYPETPRSSYYHASEQQDHMPHTAATVTCSDPETAGRQLDSILERLKNGTLTMGIGW